MRGAHAVAATALLAGCAIHTAVERDLSAVPPAKGIVVFSTGSDDTSTVFATALRLGNATSSAPLETASTDIVIDGSMVSSDFPDENGNVRMLDLAPGAYCFRAMPSDPYTHVTRAPDFAFRVEEGKISYVGNFYLTRAHGFEVRDRKERDLEVFFAANPGLQGYAVTTALVTVVKNCGPPR